ncbi:MAG: helix-turn-helix transcriptional regulator [Candidatus Kapaibacterium sp.]
MRIFAQPMPKAKQHTKRISDSDILAIYEAVLPLMYDNPKGIDLPDKINKCLLKFVWYDFIHYMMDAPAAAGKEERLGITFEDWASLSTRENEPTMALVPGQPFREIARQNYERAIEFRRIHFPNEGEFDYYRITSQKHPKIVIGFFRAKDKSNAFSEADLHTFQQLKPHILRLFRTVLTNISHSRAFQYFDSFAAIGSRIANEHKLSDAEVKLLPDILFGYTNEEMVERHFISLATVKSHVKHILKKTGTKNRIDFIGKFFTSPERVKL